MSTRDLLPPRAAVTLPSAPPSWSGPDAPESSPLSTSVPDRCRYLVRLLDQFATARQTAFGRAAEGHPLGWTAASLRMLPAVLGEEMERLSDGLTGEWLYAWRRCAILARLGQVEAVAWTDDLLQLAAEYEGQRDTEPMVSAMAGK